MSELTKLEECLIHARLCLDAGKNKRLDPAKRAYWIVCAMQWLAKAEGAEKAKGGGHG